MAPDAPALVAVAHLAGFGAGAALYAMLGAMAVTHGRGRGGDDRSPLALAALGVVWNVGALVLYALRDLGGAAAAEPAWLLAVGAAAFSALAVLPAVAVQAAAQPVARRARRTLTAAAYVVSAAAVALLWWGAAESRAVPARPALLVLTVGYAAVIALLAARLRRQPAWRAPLAAAALAAFAVTALHLRHHAPDESFAAHLLGDHASIPLALVILYQDYRVAFADRFLKRALAGLVLVALALAAHAWVVVPAVVPRLAARPADALGTAMLAAVLAGLLAAAPLVRRLVGALVDRLLLRRVDYAAVRRDVAAALGTAPAAADALDAASAHLAPALMAGRVAWRERAPGERGDGERIDGVRADARGRGAAADVPTAEPPGYVLEVGELRGGRRLLSDDLALIEWTALQTARRVDLVRVAHERCEREAREHEAVRLAAEAELRALRAQLNPHFLFNALTTIGHLVREAPDRAVATLYELTGLLRAVLRSPAGEFVSLGDELAIVEAYLAIEGARFEERLRVTVDADDAARRVRVPPLLVQPLVENAVKHGVAPLRRGGEVRVWARVEAPADGGPEVLRVRVSDTGAGAAPADVARRRAAGGLGLASVERRVERLYGDRATFAFRSRPGDGATAELVLPAGAEALGTSGGAAAGSAEAAPALRLAS